MGREAHILRVAFGRAFDRAPEWTPDPPGYEHFRPLSDNVYGRLDSQGTLRGVQVYNAKGRPLQHPYNAHIEAGLRAAQNAVTEFSVESAEPPDSDIDLANEGRSSPPQTESRFSPDSILHYLRIGLQGYIWDCLIPRAISDLRSSNHSLRGILTSDLLGGRFISMTVAQAVYNTALVTIVDGVGSLSPARSGHRQLANAQEKQEDENPAEYPSYGALAIAPLLLTNWLWHLNLIRPASAVFSQSSAARFEHSTFTSTYTATLLGAWVSTSIYAICVFKATEVLSSASLGQLLDRSTTQGRKKGVLTRYHAVIGRSYNLIVSKLSDLPRLRRTDQNEGKDKEPQSSIRDDHLYEWPPTDGPPSYRLVGLVQLFSGLAYVEAQTMLFPLQLRTMGIALAGLSGLKAASSVAPAHLKGLLSMAEIVPKLSIGVMASAMSVGVEIVCFAIQRTFIASK